MARARQLLFRIFYSTSYTVIFLFLITISLLTAADTVYQAYKANRLVDIFIIAAIYVATALIAALIYASRLYTNRSVLQGIPKTYMPVEKDDLPGRRVRKLIADGLVGSAVIAYEARPRVKKIEERSPTASDRISALTSSDEKRDENVDSTWGTIAHPGWSSPSSPDLPNLHYEPVIAELADLIEAKAVSLAPPDPLATPSLDGTPMPDERAVALLHRPEDMGLRQYIGQLMDFNVITDRSLASEFLALYERARFATDPLDEVEFRALMSIFAEILRGMISIDGDLLAQLQNDDSDYSTPGHHSYESTLSDIGSIRRSTSDNAPPRRISEDSVPSVSMDDEDGYDEHSLRIRSVPRPTMPSRYVSARSQPVSMERLDSRPTMTSRYVSASSQPELRQSRTENSKLSRGSSRSGASVIRLAGAGDPPDLPYAIKVTDAGSPS